MVQHVQVILSKNPTALFPLDVNDNLTVVVSAQKKRSSWLPDVPFWKKIPLTDGENKASSLRCFRCCKASCISEDLGFQLLWLAFESRKPAQDSSKSWMYSNVVKIYDRWCFWWNIWPWHYVGIYLFAAFIGTKGTSIGTWHQQTTQWCNDLFSVCDLLPFKERLLGCPSRGEHLRMEWRCVQSFSSLSSFSSSSTLRGVLQNISSTRHCLLAIPRSQPWKAWCITTRQHLHPNGWFKV